MDDFDKLCKQYTPIVFHYLLSMCRDEALADELTAETFYQAYLHIGKFRGECKIETWLCTIAKNSYYKELKKRNRTVPLELYEPPAGQDIMERFFDKEQSLIILKHLHSLNDQYKEVFMLRILGERSFKEIAAVFGKTESWAKVTFYRAKNMLIERMEKDT